MIEHPVPQNVTAYQFHLVGDMTLKQFLELAGGIVLAWFIWTWDIPAFIRWPFVGLSALTGFALAFMPLEERPLDQWILSFFKTVYNPTLFSWKKSIHLDFLDFTPRKTADAKPIDTVVKAPAAGLQTLLEAYSLQTQADEKSDDLEKDWLDRQNIIPSLFKEVQVPKKLAAETTFPKKLPPPTFKPANLLTFSHSLHPLLPPDNPAAVLRGEITLSPRIPKIPLVRIEQPESQISDIGGQSASDLSKFETPTPAPLPSMDIGQQPADKKPVSPAPSPAAIYMPTAPDRPNILAGIVVDKDGQVMPAAIVEIRDRTGLPVRAVKTNGLGQFTVATPLPAGTYELEAEKAGLTFDILKLEVKNEIMAPIEIRAKK